MKTNKDSTQYNWRNQRVTLSSFIRDDGTIRHPVFHSELERMDFAKRYSPQSGRKIISFYNNGKNIFIDTEWNTPTTFYTNPWKWIVFRDFSQTRCVMVGSPDCHGGQVMITLRLLGHSDEDQSAGIAVGSVHRLGLLKQARVFRIPNRCILFLAVNGRGIPHSLIVYEPLPYDLVKPDPDNVFI